MQPASELRHPRHEGPPREECWVCIAISVLFWLFGSMSMIMGMYGSKTMVLGPNYSQLFEVDSHLVSYIEVTEKEQTGPMLYGFSFRPLLGLRSSWNESHNVLLEPDYHEDLGIWLNMGSKLRVTCFIKSSGFFSILLTISEGYNGLQQWIQDPTNPKAASAWKNVHGLSGSLEYEIDQNGDYYVAVGNLNQQSVRIELLLEVNATVYNHESADSECSLGTGKCRINLPLIGRRYALLVTPPATQNSTYRWEVNVSYGVRWISYISVLAGLLSMVIALMKLLNKSGQYSEEQEVDSSDDSVSPLLSDKDDAADEDSSLSEVSCDEHYGFSPQNEDTYDAQLCTVCLDAPKSVFFIPCGHCATCLACAQRIRRSDAGTCPICRAKIGKIRRLYNV